MPFLFDDLKTAMTMMRSAILIGLFLAPVVAEAQERPLSWSQKLQVYQACRADLRRQCPEAGMDPGRIAACLRTHHKELSETCLARIRVALAPPAERPHGTPAPRVD
jgi:Cysteine rich repeat